jgi:hypothetical protein
MWHNAFVHNTDFSKVAEAGILGGLLTALVTACFVVVVLGLPVAAGMFYKERKTGKGTPQ